MNRLLRRLACAVVLLLVGKLALAQDDVSLLQELADRAQIQEVAFRYIEALDTRNAELYLSVFTEDAVYDVEGTLYQGHEALRGIITGLQAARDRALAEGRPVLDLYHSNLNPQVTLLDERHARYRAYWQTLRLAEDNAMRIGGMGLIEDELVKGDDGRWRIRHRVLSNFVPRNF